MRRAIRDHLGDFLAILALMAVGIGVTAYILSNQRLRFPIVEEQPFRVKAELPDAQAVTPGQGQTVRVAGVRIGDIGRVDLERGRAVVELQLDNRYRGLVRDDATALLRTKTGLKDMFIEVEPGKGRPLAGGERIRVQNTAPDIDPDEILAALDRDTRDYLKLLVSGAGKGLEGGGSDLRETWARFGPLHRDLARLNRAVARRRSSLARLVNRYGLLVRELGARDGDLARLVQQANAVFGAFASEERNLSAFVAKLPGALRETRTALGKVDRFGARLGPALESLRPAFRALDGANRQVTPLAREGTPILRDRVRPFARVAVPYTRDIGRGAGGLAEANPDLTTSFRGLNRLFNIGAYNPGGTEPLTGDLATDRARNEGYLFWLAWVGHNTTNLFNVQDAQGPFRRITLGGLNCEVFKEEAMAAGIPEAQADFLVGLFGGIGACSP